MLLTLRTAASVLCCAALVSGAGAHAAAAQDSGSRRPTPPRYQAGHDTVYYEAVNPFRLYLVRDGDTIGPPVRRVSLEWQMWRGAVGRRDGVDVVVAATEMDVSRRVRTDTVALTERGVTTAINGRPVGPGGRADLALHLPPVPLAPGVRWSDTLALDSAGVIGRITYTVVRSYRVTRLLDTLGARAAEVAAEGTVHFRHAWWVDSAKGRYIWLDARGPVTERYWFDPARGRLLARSSEMDLRGVGGSPEEEGGGVDTVPAGLQSRLDVHRIGSERYHLLARELPGRDSSLTVAPDPILLHTVARRGGAEIEAGLARNDGLVGTARARYADGRLAAYEGVWTTPAPPAGDAAVATQRVERRGDSLVVHRSARDAAGRETTGPDTVLALPASAWAVADHGMDEFLVPALLTLPADGAEHTLAVYRPSAGRWDNATASVRPADSVFVATLRLGAERGPHVLVLSRDGDLLLEQTTGAPAMQRVPPAGSERRARLEALVARLRGGS